MTARTALEISDTIINELHRFPERKAAASMLREQHAEIARLQRIIDTRPAMNSGIAEAYVAWSSGIYKSEIARADRIDS